MGTQPYGIYIDKNNTIYVLNAQSNLIQVWAEGRANLTNSIAVNASQPQSLFVHPSGDIYISNGVALNRAGVWKPNSSSYITALDVGGECLNIFIDIYESLYCSIYNDYRVTKRSLNSSDNLVTTVAGLNYSGMGNDELNQPCGIFVDTNLDLYVADASNHRIQLFLIGQTSGMTVAGSSAPQTIDLSFPTGIALDANGYLFIVDAGDSRIVGSSANGFRCLVGCTSTAGVTPDRLNSPKSIAFDTHGNIFIVDTGNSRVQKFLLLTNSCSK